MNREDHLFCEGQTGNGFLFDDSAGHKSNRGQFLAY